MSNQFQAFATSGGANALTATAWAALTAILANGFQSGVASSEQINTAFRQALAGSNLLGNFIDDQGLNALDDGNTANLLTAFKNALQNLLALKGGATGQAFQAADGASGKQVVNISQFGKSLAAAGYQRLPGGLIIQWGSGTTAAGGVVGVTFPIAFPTAPLIIIPAVGTSTPTNYSVGAGNSTTTGFNAYVANASGSGVSGVTTSYIAVGS